MNARDAYIELYGNFNLEQLQTRLNLAAEEVVKYTQRLLSETIRYEVINELIEKEKNRLTEYYNSLEQ